MLLLGRGTVGGRLLAQLEETRGGAAEEPGHRRAAVRRGGPARRARRSRRRRPRRPAAPLAARRRARPRILADAPRPPLPPGRCRCSWTAPPRTGWSASTSRRSGAASTWWRRTRSRWRSRWSDGPRCPSVARRHFRAWHYETTVGAGLPVIETLKNLVATGDVVERIDGSLSGHARLPLPGGDGRHPALGRGRAAPGPRVHRAAPARRPVRPGRGPEGADPRPRAGPPARARRRRGRAVRRRLAARRGRPGAIPPVARLPRRDLRRPVARYAAAGRTLRYLVQIRPRRRGAKGQRRPRGGRDRTPRGAAARAPRRWWPSPPTATADYPLIVRGAGAGGDVTAAGVLADVLRLTQNVRGRR